MPKVQVPEDQEHAQPGGRGLPLVWEGYLEGPVFGRLVTPQLSTVQAPVPHRHAATDRAHPYSIRM